MPYVFQCTGREDLAMMLASSTKYRREEEPKKAKKKQEQNMWKNQKTKWQDTILKTLRVPF
jgi:hypothetical protein